MKISGPIDLIKQSFSIFFKKENLLYFLKIYAVLAFLAAVTYIIDFYSGNFGLGPDITSLVQNINSIPVVLLVLTVVIGLIQLIVSFWVGAAGILAIDGAVKEKKLTFKEVFKNSWKKIWGFSVLSVLVGLIVGAGFVLLIIPGIIFLVWFHFAGFEYMTKEVGVTAAISASKRLVSGKFFAVLGRIVVFGIFGLLVDIIFGLIPINLGEIIQPLFGALLTLPYFLLYLELTTG